MSASSLILPQFYFTIIIIYFLLLFYLNFIGERHFSFSSVHHKPRLPSPRVVITHTLSQAIILVVGCLSMEILK